nr:MAG TPA: hypothetical protein [Bacteriophage sp.]
MYKGWPSLVALKNNLLLIFSYKLRLYHHLIKMSHHFEVVIL